MQSNRSRILMIAVSVLFVLSLLAASLPYPAQAAVSSADTGNFTAYAKNGKIYINLSGVSGKHSYLAKVRDARQQKAGNWKKLGQFKINRKSTVSTSYNIPKPLRNSIYLNVCLKDRTYDKLTCRVVVNPNGRY